jgi:glycosyltransferase involved in cell wall biosynthesis
MKVALYYPWLYLRSGGERTITELLRRSKHDWTLITNRYEAESTFEELKSARIVELSRVSVNRSMKNVLRAAYRIVGQRLPLEGQDALVVFCEGLGDLVTFRNSGIPMICVCLTPLRAAFDPHYQQNYLALKGNTRMRRVALSVLAKSFRLIDRVAWKRYSRVFAISQEVRNRIVAGGLRKQDDVGIIYPGIDLSNLIPTGVRERNFLIPGRIMWTKNIELGIQAFLKLLERRCEFNTYTLTIAGFVDQKSKPYRAKLRAMAGECAQIQFVESPSDEILFHLYRSCYAVLFTPFNEDWGLVPLEAMALEKPVIAVDRGGPRETIVHGETGFLAEPDAQSFSLMMERLADSEELANSMGTAGRRRAARFQWVQFCETLDDNLDEVVESRNKLQFYVGKRLKA